MVVGPVGVLGAGLFAVAGAAIILVVIARWSRTPGALGTAAPAVFLFEGEALVDASPPARRFLAAQGPRGQGRAVLLALLSRGWGADLAQRLAARTGRGALRLSSETGHGTLEAEGEGGALRLTLRAEEPGEPPLDRLLLEAAQEELGWLRGLADAAPQPIWAADAGRHLAWANRAYLDLADRADAGADAPDGPRWPATPLFSPTEGAPRHREALLLPDVAEPLWFDVTEVPREGGTLGVATEVSDLVRAEAARAQFVQALAKTFAHLSTGLAIFDRDRRLALFNPAFVELTGLPPPLLSGRPSVHGVLDRLRDAGVLPEPRSYAGWREEVAALEAAAEKGHYADTWALASGRTLRVTGRPHPDGAIAFLFEDISDELGETRRLRAQAEAAHAALDATGGALALFDAAGVLAFATAAYRDLWGLPAPDLPREVDRWADACEPAPAWAALREGPRRAAQDEPVAHRDGRHLRLRATPLPRGGTLVSFRSESP